MYYAGICNGDMKATHLPTPQIHPTTYYENGRGKSFDYALNWNMLAKTPMWPLVVAFLAASSSIVIYYVAKRSGCVANCLYEAFSLSADE